jgi:hypothetical protein
MANREKDIRLFERVAQQRLKAAWFLFNDEAKEFNLDATYLAGYAVECALKALILKRTPRKQHEEMVENLTEVGALGHDFEYLKGILKGRLQSRAAQDREVLGKISVCLQRVSHWETTMRYRVGYISTSNASSFMEAAQEIVDWCLRG